MITQELVNYIKSQLSAGQTREQITVMLLGSNAGWVQSDIDQVFQSIGTNNASQPIVTQSVQSLDFNQTQDTELLNAYEKITKILKTEVRIIVYTILGSIVIAVGLIFGFGALASKLNMLGVAIGLGGLVLLSQIWVAISILALVLFVFNLIKATKLKSRLHDIYNNKQPLDSVYVKFRKKYIKLCIFNSIVIALCLFIIFG